MKLNLLTSKSILSFLHSHETMELSEFLMRLSWTLPEVNRTIFVKASTTKPTDDYTIQPLAEIKVVVQTLSFQRLLLLIRTYKEHLKQLGILESWNELSYQLNSVADTFETGNDIDLPSNGFDLLTNAYERYLKTHNTYDLYVLVTYAHELYIKMSSFSHFLYVLGDQLVASEGKKLPKNQQQIYIELNPKDHVAAVVEKLDAINSIYRELCMLLKVSEAEYPLRILQLESGSLWLRLFGESKVIGLFTDLIKSGVGYIHRNFTMDGKRGNIPTEAERLKEVLDLEELMRKRGFNTDEMRDVLAKSAILIVKHQNILLGGEPVVRINDDEFTVVSAVDRMIAERKQTLLLESKQPEEIKSDKSKGKRKPKPQKPD